MKAIILNKTKFKERDLICHLLVPNGGQVSCLFYGGAGGGTKRKSSVLEIGHVIEVTFQNKKNEIQTDLEIAKEYQLVWNYDKIRLNHRAFYLLSFFLELILKVARPLHHDELDYDDHAELFNVLSNAIFYLEQDVDHIDETHFKHLCIFLSKLSHAMGVFPEVSECLYCGIDLNGGVEYALQKTEGGFACHDCLAQKEEHAASLKHIQISKRLRAVLVKSLQTLYKNHSEVANSGLEETNELLDYLFFQFHFQKHQFKTLRMIL